MGLGYLNVHAPISVITYIAQSMTMQGLPYKSF